MTNHEHKECEHEMAYCKVCQIPYCKKCGKEWKDNYNYIPYYPTIYPYTTPWYTGTGGTGVQVTYTAGSLPNSANITHNHT